jgi:hypothetical protein
MKIVTNKGAYLELDINEFEDDLTINTSKYNNLWFIKQDKLIIKDIISVLNDQRNFFAPKYKEEGERVDVFIYFKNSEKTLKIENVNRANVKIKISEKTNFQFQIKINEDDLNFYIKEEYISGIVIKAKDYKENIIKGNELFILLKDSVKFIKLENVETKKQINAGSQLIIFASNNQKEIYFINLIAFWLNKKEKTGNYNYVIGYKNNNKIILKNKNKIEYEYTKSAGIKLDINDDSITYITSCSDIDYIKQTKSHTKQEVSSIKSKNKLIIKDI